MKKFKTIRLQLLIWFVGFIIIFFAIAVWVSNDIKKTVREVMLSEENFGNIYEDNISEDAFNSFFRREIYGSYEGGGVEIQLYLSNPIPIHYFLGGYIRMTYAYKGIDSETKQVRFGSNVPIRLKVRLTNGHWKIVEKWEKP